MSVRGVRLLLFRCGLLSTVKLLNPSVPAMSGLDVARKMPQVFSVVGSAAAQAHSDDGQAGDADGGARANEDVSQVHGS